MGRYFAAMAALFVLASPARIAFANPTRVAVVGGGIAGVTTVLELIERGFTNVTLIERNSDLLQSTSSMIAVSEAQMIP